MRTIPTPALPLRVLLRAGVSAGMVGIIAAAMGCNAAGASSASRVNPSVISIAVAINPANDAVLTGQEVQFTATVTGTTNTAVIWKVDGVQGGTSGSGTISSAGLYTAPSVAGQHTITAESAADNSKTADATLKVNTPPPTPEQLSVSVTGNGTAVSNPPGIDCPSECTASFDSGTRVTLTATAAPGFSFSDFGGACVGTSCELDLASDQSVTATFIKNQVSLTVKVIGSGTVESNPPGINCPTVCTARYDVGTQVDLTATPDSGSKLSGFAGACGGTSCQLNLATDASVTAAFLQIPPAPLPVQVLTERYDNRRDGINPNENVLTPDNVNAYLFGKIASYPVDGPSYAQPLYVSGLNIAGKTRNVVFVATESDSVYAFDATGAASGPLWHRSFIDPGNGITTLPAQASGITSTPVIDLATNTLYVVVPTVENGVWIQRLHALDIATGAEKFGGPQQIQANVNGVILDPTLNLNRSSLLLVNGTLLFAEGALEIGAEKTTYHGWILAYDPSTLQPMWSWTSTADGQQGGIWMSGCGLAADAQGYIYGATGNGTYNQNAGGSSYANSVVKLSALGSLVDFFTPYNQLTLNQNDLDLASGGVMLIPGTNLATIAGKDGSIYLLNINTLGQYQTGSNSQIVEYLPAALGNGGPERSFSTPAFYNDYLYYSGEYDVMKQFQLKNGKLSTSPVSTTRLTFGYRGVQPTVSANGNNQGIVWVSEYISGANGILHAFDASDINRELYNSEQNSARDSYGHGIAFSVPTVAEGRVYVMGDHELAIFGLLNP